MNPAPRPNPEPTAADDDQTPEKQTPRTIRFHDRDWDLIETFAVMRGVTTSELIRATVLTAIGAETPPPNARSRLVPQIELIFRYTHILATALRDEMRENGRGEQLEALVRSARELQGELNKGPGTER